ncbi:zinc-binding alcohol dehydrogenase family protein [Microbacterium rhizomatis]|uniref:Zinc-binding alcohol dehydrogenase family protein n=2 Tax=Microbacterium rhizomatis TaxID=1631477 RepID=A0A5J5J1V4_9MICO|nr:zinc-binding alcohol dehydrogenase family protein [Microbacterium rhizomatis]
MNAALVTAWGAAPHYTVVPAPTARDGEVLVDVLAVGLHPRTRSGAAGAHYTSTGRLPLIPGVDGVGRRPDGRLVYFAADDDVDGTMADRAAIDPRRAIELPEGVDVARIAAAMNPAMSSWVALRARVRFEAGKRVLVLGATGNAGSMAVQIAKLLGAGTVVAAGRDRARLNAITGADARVPLTDDAEATASALSAMAADVDIVLDYLWGVPTQRAIVALLTARSDRSRPLDWVQIGSVAGPTLELPSAALRSANLRLLGSGQGAVSPRGYLAELPALVERIDAGEVSVSPRAAALADVERVWGEPEVPGERIVLTP